MTEVDSLLRFGAELKDGFKPVNAWVGHGIGWLDDVQSFYRERSAIEKEYAGKLSTLAKKYYEKKTRKSTVLSVGENPATTPGSLESASMTTWTVQLNALEACASEHERYSAELTTTLAEPLKYLMLRFEELRKRHAEYAIKLEKERDGSYSDLRRMKGRYDSVCQEVENRRRKLDSSLDHGKSKAQNAYQQQQLDMHNAKNAYLINLNVVNKQKEKYYHEYIPDLLDSLQDLSELRVAKLNSIWAQAATLEKTTLKRNADIVEHVLSEIPRNNPVLDSMMFARHNTTIWQEPPDLIFEPSPVWLDDDVIVTTEAAKIFLLNILGRSKSQLSELRGEVETKRRDVENMRRKKENIRLDKDHGDEVEVAHATVGLQEHLHDVERKKTTAEVEVATIISAVGDVRVGARNHNFRPQTFKIPTNCDLCGERIWGLSAKGFDCRDCGFTCHSKCELKVPADCPGESTKEERKKLKAERTEVARNSQRLEEPESEIRLSGADPVLIRSDTINSMTTLSSGYAESNNRAVSSTLSIPTNEQHESVATLVTQPLPTPRSHFKLPPLPYQYLEITNGNGVKPSQQRAKVVYAYQKNGQGELSVREGMEVLVLEPDDGSGWIRVRAGYLEGVVPASYLEIQPSAPSASDMERPASTYSTSSVSLAGSITGSTAAGRKKGPAVAPKKGAKKLKYVEAIYEYTARGDDEHSLAEGERLVLINMDTGDGWADVEKHGSIKSVPANYIQEVL